MNFKEGNGKRWIGVIFLLLALSSCRSLRNNNTLFLSEHDKAAHNAKSVYIANENSSIDKNYKIKPLDLIAVQNLQNPEGLVAASNSEGMSSAPTFKIGADGIVSLPVIGPVELKGLTVEEARKKVEDLYGKLLLKNPIIDLKVVNYQITLLGESSKPGNYFLERENINLIELLGKSGGLLPSSNPKKIKIIRGDRNNPEIIYVNLQDINSLGNEKLILQNNDIVYITPKGLSNISEGIKNYSAIIQPVFLVLNGVLLIYTLGR